MAAGPTDMRKAPPSEANFESLSVFPELAGRRSTRPFQPLTVIPPPLTLRSASWAVRDVAANDATSINAQILILILLVKAGSKAGGVCWSTLLRRYAPTPLRR